MKPLSSTGETSGTDVVALVLTEGSGDVLDQLTLEFPAKFPYTRTHLAYRELPGYLRAVEAAGRTG